MGTRLQESKEIRLVAMRDPVFKGCFHIQEFYELTLLDDSKSIQQKTAETIRIANKWEANEGPITTPFKNDRNKISWYANREDNIVRDGAPDAAGPGRVRDIREVRLLFCSSDFPNSMLPLK
ncbi:hypothetical protein RUM43_002133 [Polyplax serrata]|uniref:Uncharacterized protein n=1 Tax=Polyplax serrata TaxID=468196 RepID=A0AAN8NYU5_POLSC